MDISNEISLSKLSIIRELAWNWQNVSRVKLCPRQIVPWRSSAWSGTSSKVTDCMAATSTKTSRTRSSLALETGTHWIWRCGDLKQRSKNTTLWPLAFSALAMATLNVSAHSGQGSHRIGLLFRRKQRSFTKKVSGNPRGHIKSQ